VVLDSGATSRTRRLDGGLRAGTGVLVWRRKRRGTALRDAFERARLASASPMSLTRGLWVKPVHVLACALIIMSRVGT